LIAACTEKADQTVKPNIIYILADDLGYGDLGCFGQEVIQTPEIDRMAAQGMKFTSHYSGSTVCAPSRCTLMTGLHTGHARIRGNSTFPLMPGDLTVAEILQKNGYKTALIGKWGLGEAGTTGTPNKKGFDYFFGYLNQIRAHNSYPDYLWRNEEKVPLDNKVEIIQDTYARGIGSVAREKRTHSHTLFTQESLDFITANKDSSFFLYLAYTIPHANNEGIPMGQNGMEVPDLGIYKNESWPEAQKAHAAMISLLDKDVGRILTRLAELRIDKNTLVFFTSDNGPHKEGGADPEFFDSNGPLRGMKRELYEGGIRVPTIAWWPGKIQEGTESDHISAFWDFLPTACDIAGVRLTAKTDGISFLPAMTGGEQQRHEFLYWEFVPMGGRLAALKDNWKAVRYNMTDDPDAAIQLFDLSQDISEEHDVAADHPEIVENIKSLMSLAHTSSDVFQFNYEKNP
jgi:arylsulfatase A-like enzyme